MFKYIAIVILSVFVFAACGPDAPPKSDSEIAIEQAFGHLGPGVVQEAKNVAWCESKWNPNLVYGQYRGLFQLGYNYNATIDFYGGNVFDPYTNAQVARDSYVTNGHSWIRFECQP